MGFTAAGRLAPGRRVLIIGATGGIGAALAHALRAQALRDEAGTELICLSRDSAPPIDVTDEASVAAAAVAVGAPLHVIINAAGALHVNGRPPEKQLRDLDGPTLQAAFAVNAVGPALVLKHFAPLLPRDERAVFATLSARVGSIGDNHLGGWYGYRASKAALNQFVRTAAIEIARTRPLAVVLCIHPGTVKTRLSAPITGGMRGDEPAVAAARILAVIEGTSETGVFLDQNGETVMW
jgi:NAD(P)-dependent dehydrogenase (short-subunit alcohol dehydrogenase family)